VPGSLTAAVLMLAISWLWFRELRRAPVAKQSVETATG